MVIRFDVDTCSFAGCRLPRDDDGQAFADSAELIEANWPPYVMRLVRPGTILNIDYKNR